MIANNNKISVKWDKLKALMKMNMKLLIEGKAGKLNLTIALPIRIIMVMIVFMWQKMVHQQYK